MQRDMAGNNYTGGTLPLECVVQMLTACCQSATNPRLWHLTSYCLVTVWLLCGRFIMCTKGTATGVATGDGETSKRGRWHTTHSRCISKFFLEHDDDLHVQLTPG